MGIPLKSGPALVILFSGWEGGFLFTFPRKHQSMSLYCLQQCYDHIEQPGGPCVTDHLNNSVQSSHAAGESCSDTQKGHGSLDSFSASSSHLPLNISETMADLLYLSEFCHPHWQRRPRIRIAVKIKQHNLHKALNVPGMLRVLSVAVGVITFPTVEDKIKSLISTSTPRPEENDQIIHKCVATTEISERSRNFCTLLVHTPFSNRVWETEFWAESNDMFVCLFHSNSLFQKWFETARREIHLMQQDIKLDVANKFQKENRGKKIKLHSIWRNKICNGALNIYLSDAFWLCLNPVELDLEQREKGITAFECIPQLMSLSAA